MKTRTILFKGKEIQGNITPDGEEFFWRISPFGGQDYEVEFSVDLTKPFDERNWEHIPDLLAFLDENLPYYLERSLEILPTFAETSGLFNTNELQNLDFGFEYVINIPDNWLCWHEDINKKLEKWGFELIFVESNYDDYGRYIVFFEGKLLSGIRRENS